MDVLNSLKIGSFERSFSFGEKKWVAKGKSSWVWRLSTVGICFSCKNRRRNCFVHRCVVL